MSGHQPAIGHGAVADAVPQRSRSKWGAFAGHRLGDRGPPTQASSRTGGQRPAATATSRGAGTRSSPAPPTTRTTSWRRPSPQPACIQHAPAGKEGMPPSPSNHHPNRIVL